VLLLIQIILLIT